jgi:hypothetical protein
MRNIGLGIMGLIILTAAVQAATPAPKTQAPLPASPAPACFDVVPNEGQGAPADAILVNRCTGETWILVRAPVPDANGEDSADFTYTWLPLSTGQDKPVLQMSGPRQRDD